MHCIVLGGASLKPLGYTWSYLACRTGHLVPRALPELEAKSMDIFWGEGGGASKGVHAQNSAAPLIGGRAAASVAKTVCLSRCWAGCSAQTRDSRVS
jgi:hypothetical protein